MSNQLSEFTIAIKLVNSEKLKATCAIKYLDHVVRGFRIAPSKFQDEVTGEFLRVLPPAYGVESGKPHLAFFMEDKQLWKEVVGRIIVAYQTASNGGAKGISPSDIPF